MDRWLPSPVVVVVRHQNHRRSSKEESDSSEHRSSDEGTDLFEIIAVIVVLLRSFAFLKEKTFDDVRLRLP